MQELGLLQKMEQGEIQGLQGRFVPVCALCCLSLGAGPLPVCMLTSFFSFSRAAGLKFRPWVSAMAPHWAVWLLAAGLWGLGMGAEMWWNLVPRKTVSSGGECLKLGRGKG